MNNLLKDIRYGIRGLLKRPGFTSIAILTLALGIGANTAIFSVVNGVLFHPLPYQNPDQLVMLWENDTREGNDRNPVAPANFVDWRKQNEVCSELGYFSQPGGLSLTGSGEPERLMAIGVSQNLFSLLGVSPIVGHQLTPFDEKSDQQLEAILSYGLWQQRFGGDAGVIGKPINLDGTPFIVAGVMPAHFQLPEDADLWYQTLNGEITTMRGQHFMRAVGRLKPGVNLPQARTSFATIARRLEQQYPETNSGYSVNVVTFQDQLVGDVRTALFVLLGAVGFVLLIACANVANLLLARAIERQKEISIRSALGASRVHLMRQLLAESLILAMAGGVLGLLLAVWGVDLLASFGTGKIPRAEFIFIDRRAFGFTVLVTMLTGIIFGLVPAWFASKTNLQGALREAGQNAISSVQRGRLRNVLVVAEVALALVLLAGGGLMIRTLMRLHSVDLGFDHSNVLTMQFSLPGKAYSKPEQIASFYQQMVTRVGALPGVRAAGAVSRLPLAGDRSTSGLVIEGRPQSAGEKLEVHYRVVTPGYFRAMGIPLLAGREHAESDTQKTPGVVLINAALAHQYWPNGDALDKRIRLGPNAKAPWVTVAGIVANARNFGFDTEAKPEIYVSYLQGPTERMRLVIRTTTEPHSLVSAIREAVRGLDPDLAFSQVATMDELLAKSIVQRRLIMLLLAVFSAVALLLATVGIYGVMSYAVRQRTHEVGIRMALGAQASDVLKLIVKMGMTLALTGTVIGLIGAFALTRLMSKLLFGIAPTDAATFATVAAGLLLVALLACYIPARRATKVDPLVALRYE